MARAHLEAVCVALAARDHDAAEACLSAFAAASANDFTLEGLEPELRARAGAALSALLAETEGTPAPAPPTPARAADAAGDCADGDYDGGDGAADSDDDEPAAAAANTPPRGSAEWVEAELKCVAARARVRARARLSAKEGLFFLGHG